MADSQQKPDASAEFVSIRHALELSQRAYARELRLHITSVVAYERKARVIPGDVLARARGLLE